MNNKLTVSKINNISPCFFIEQIENTTPLENKTAVIFLHAYGGCKEELVGLALHIAGENYDCFVYDLPGHGENNNIFNLKYMNIFTENILENIQNYRSFYLVGHSIGASLALSIGAHKVVAISPPGEFIFEGRQTEMNQTIRVRRVKEEERYKGLRDTLLEYQNISDNISNCLVLYSKNDIRSSREKALSLADKKGFIIKRIDASNHLDIITARQTIHDIKEFLRK